MIHQIIGNNDLPFSILEYFEELKEGIRLDILSQQNYGGLKYISDLGSNSIFGRVASTKTVGEYRIIKATTHSNQLVKNIINYIISESKGKLVLTICNKEFNKRHKLFDSSSTSLQTIHSTIEKLELIIKPEFWLDSIAVLEIDSVTRSGELIETGFDQRTFINQ